MPPKVYPTQTGVRIVVAGQGPPGPPGPPGAGGDVEDLGTQGALGTVPTSDGAGGLDMTVPSGSGNVVSPGSETVGRITKFVGSNSIEQTATTEAQLEGAVTHAALSSGNPHAVDATDVGADPAGTASGLIDTHTGDPDAHHAEAHTAESHTGQSSTGAQVDTAVTHSTTTTGNPHALNSTDVGADAAGTAAGLISTHAGFTDVHHAQGHTVASHTDTDATGPELNELTDGSETTLHSHAGAGGPGSDTTAIHRDENGEFGSITDDPSPPGTGRLIAETAAGVKFRVNIGNLPTGGGGEANLLASIGTLGQGLAAAVPKDGITLQTKNIAPTSPQVLVTADGNDNVLVDVDGFEIPIITQNGGFQDRTESTLSKVDGTRTFTITPTGADYVIWVAGTKFVIDDARDVIWDDTTGAKTLYFDTSGVLQVQNSSVTGADQRTKCLIAFIYWDTTTGATAAFTEERHGFQTGPDMREYLHEVLAAQWVNGLQLAITSIDGDGDTDAHGHVSMSSGFFHDEDLKHVITDGSPQDLTPIAQILVYYLTGPVGAPVLKQRAPSDFAFINDSDSLWTGRVPFNELAGGTTWQLTEVTNNNHVLVHLFATGGLDNPIVAFQGQAEYTTIALARAGAGEELNALIFIGLGSKEIVPLATFILQTGNGMANLAQAAIMSTSTADYVDWRTTPRAGASGLTVNEHNSLAGRDNIESHEPFLDHAGTRAMTGDLNLNSNDIQGGIELGGTLTDVGLVQYMDEVGSIGFFGDPLSPAIIVAADPNFNVATGTGSFHTGATINSALGIGDWPAANGNTIALGEIVYVGVEWNAGTPQVVFKSTNVWTFILEWPLGIVSRDTDGIHIVTAPPRLSNFASLIDRRIFETETFARSNGLNLSTTGLTIKRSSGRGWVVTTPVDYAEYDTNVASTIDRYFGDGGGGFNVQLNETEFEDSSFDDGSGSLAALGNNRYGVRWLYMDLASGELALIYGTSNTTDLAVALRESIPGAVPPRIDSTMFIYGRIVFQRAAGVSEEAQDRFGTGFSPGGGGDGDVSGPAGGVVAGEIPVYADATGKALAGSSGLLFGNVSQVGHTHAHGDLTGVTSDQHHPQVHDLAGADHNSATLSAFNAKISDANLDADTASRPPNGTAGGDLAATFPNPTVAAITTTTGPTKLTIGAVADGEFLKRVGSTLVGDTPAGGGGGGLAPYSWSAIELWSANTANWAVNGNAPLVQDSNDSMMTVRRSDNATEEGFGQEFTVRTGSSSMEVITIARAETAPGGAVVAKPLIRFRLIDDGAAVGSWGSPIALTDIDLGTNEFFVKDETDDTLTNWGLTAGSTYQFQITRTPTADTLASDLTWKRIEFEFT